MMGETMFRLRSRATKTRFSVAVALAMIASAGSARANDVPSAGDAPAVAPPQAMAEARKQFQAGVNLLDDPDGAKYEEAYSAFKKAFELSQSPKVLGNIGFCAMHLERDGEAIDAYTKYLGEAPDVPERERAQISRDLATLTSTVARVHVVVKHASARFTLVDTRGQTRGPSVENTYSFEGNELTIRVRPGRHTLKVKADGSDEESIAVDAALEPASLVTRELQFAPPKAATQSPMLVQRSPSVAGPVFLGITGVLAIGAGTTFGLLARGKANAIASRCPSDVCPPDYDLASARSSAKTFGTIADVGLAGGGALLLGGLLWYALLPSARTTSMASTASAMCTREGCALQLQRGF
jgi:hypothetical protein